VERLIGSIRRECVDHIIVLGEAHLRRILKSYADYNGIRTHRSLNKDAPVIAKFSESEASNHTLFLADFTTTTPELKFSVHTTDGRSGYQRPSDKQVHQNDKEPVPSKSANRFAIMLPSQLFVFFVEQQWTVQPRSEALFVFDDTKDSA
jgi:hypothetical protein